MLSYDHQKSRYKHTHTDESFDHIKMKCQDLRPPNIVRTEISDAISVEAGFAYEGPDPAPSEAVTTLLPNHYWYCIFTIVGNGLSHLRTSDLSASTPTQMPLEVSHSNRYRLLTRFSTMCNNRTVPSGDSHWCCQVKPWTYDRANTPWQKLWSVFPV